MKRKMRDRRSYKVDETEQKMVDREIRREREKVGWTDTQGIYVSPSWSQWGVSDPPCLLCEYSPGSDSISNSLINQELCYVTLPPPLTQRRENHNCFFFHRCTQVLCYCVHPLWTINTRHQVCSQAGGEIWEIIFIVGPSEKKTY